MLKRAICIYISFSLLCLFPSLYGIVYCFVSEKMIKIVPIIENKIVATKDKFRTGEMISQYNKFLEGDTRDLTKNPIWKHHKEIIYKCSDFSRAGFNDDRFVHGYVSFVIMAIDSKSTLSLIKLKILTYDLLLYLDDTLGKENELFGYNENKDKIRIELPPPRGDLAGYTALLRLSLLEKARSGGDLETREASVQENLQKHIAKLEESLHAIRAARLAHEPHRPMIRFIGWSLLIFESIGMALLLGVVYIEIKAWGGGKDARRE